MAESGGFWRATTANSPCSEPTSPDRKPSLRNVVSPPSQAVAGDLRHRQMDGGPPFFTDLGRCEFRPGRQNNPVGTVHAVPDEPSTGNAGSRPGIPRKPARLGASSSFPDRRGESAVGSQCPMAQYLYILSILIIYPIFTSVKGGKRL